MHLELSVNLPDTLLLFLLALLSPYPRKLVLINMSVCDAQALIAQLSRVLPGLDRIYLEWLWTKINVRSTSELAPPTNNIFPNGSNLDAPYEQGVKAYLLGQADDFPRLTAEMISRMQS